jgi:hypothetical protein
MAAAIAPRPIFLQNLVDGLNKYAAPDAIQKEYASGTTVINANKNADCREMVNWMAQRLLVKK